MNASKAPSGTLPARDRALLLLLSAGFLIGALPQLVDYFHMRTFAIEGAEKWVGHDFFVYWAAAKLLFAGHVDQLYDVAAFTAYQLGIVDPPPGFYYPWPYPPHALFLVLPFGFLSYAAAYFLWMIPTFLFYAWAGGEGRIRPGLALILLCSPAAVVTILNGQNSFLTAGLFMGGFLLLERRPVLAGILFGILTFKPQIGWLIPIALIAARMWRPFFAAAATGIGLAVMSAIAFGAERWLEYLAFMPGFQDTLLNNPNHLIPLAPTIFMAAKIAGLGIPFAYALQAMGAIMVAVVVYLVFRHGRNRTMQAATIAVGAILATPYAFHYDLTLASLAVVLTTAEGWRTGFFKGERLLLILAWFMPVAVIGFNTVYLPLSPIFLVAAFLMMAARAMGWAEEESAQPICLSPKTAA